MNWNEAFPYTFLTLRRKYGIPEPSKAGLIERCRCIDLLDFICEGP